MARLWGFFLKSALVVCSTLPSSVNAAVSLTLGRPSLLHSHVDVQDARSSQTSVRKAKARIGAEWTALAGDLWSSLIIKSHARDPFARTLGEEDEEKGEEPAEPAKAHSNSSNSSVKPLPDLPDFNASDTKTKKDFLARCEILFDTPDFAVPDDVVFNMCQKTGAYAMECTELKRSLWQAHEDKKISQWCVRAFDLFAEYTKPKCPHKCRALLCKTRCQVADMLKDVDDEIAGYQYKLNQVEEQEEKLEEAQLAQEKLDKEIVEFNSSEVMVASSMIKQRQADLEDVNKLLADLTKEVEEKKVAKDAARKALNATILETKNGTKYPNEDTAKLAIEQAQSTVTSASHALQEAQELKSVANRRVLSAQDAVKQQKLAYERKSEKLREMQAELEKGAEKLKNDKGVREGKKEELQQILKDLEFQKSTLELKLSTKK